MDILNITIKGHAFVIELHEKRTRAVFVDTARAYRRVAEVHMDADFAADYHGNLQPMLRLTIRRILAAYREQYVARRKVPYKVTMLDAVQLTDEERRAFVGLSPKTAAALRAQGKVTKLAPRLAPRKRN